MRFGIGERCGAGPFPGLWAADFGQVQRFSVGPPMKRTGTKGQRDDMRARRPALTKTTLSIALLLLAASVGGAQEAEAATVALTCDADAPIDLEQSETALLNIDLDARSMTMTINQVFKNARFSAGTPSTFPITQITDQKIGVDYDWDRGGVTEHFHDELDRSTLQLTVVGTVSGATWVSRSYHCTKLQRQF